jgi:hypothetical protein
VSVVGTTALAAPEAVPVMMLPLTVLSASVACGQPHLSASAVRQASGLQMQASLGWGGRVCSILLGLLRCHPCPDIRGWELPGLPSLIMAARPLGFDSSPGVEAAARAGQARRLVRSDGA